MTDTKKEEIKMFDNIIENTKRNISSATLMAIAITILESYFLIKGNFPISYTILCAILFYVGWVVFCSIKYTENNHRLNFMDNRGNQEATNLHKSRSKAK